MQPVKILLPADGEARNGVFDAKIGCQVTKVDLSAEGKLKALPLAEANRVTLCYIVGDLEGLQFKPASFDVVRLIYAHFEADQKAALHCKLNSYLQPGGMLILNAFSKEHLKINNGNPKVGGPKEPDMLYSAIEIQMDFPEHDIILLKEKDVLLNEGQYHVGTGAVVRFVGKKHK